MLNNLDDNVKTKAKKVKSFSEKKYEQWGRKERKEEELEEFIEAHSIAQRTDKDYDDKLTKSYLIPISEEAEEAYHLEKEAKFEEKQGNKTKAQELRKQAQILLKQPQKKVILERVIDPKRSSDSQVRVKDASTQEVSALSNMIKSVGQRDSVYVKYYGKNSPHTVEIKTGNKRWRVQSTNSEYTPRFKKEGEYDPPGYLWVKFIPSEMAEKEVRDLQLRLDCEHLGGENLTQSEVYENLKKDIYIGKLDNQHVAFDQMDEKEQKKVLRKRIKDAYPIYAVKAASIAKKIVKDNNYQTSKFETYDKKTITYIGTANLSCLSPYFEKQDLDELQNSIEKGDARIHTGAVFSLRKKDTAEKMRVGFTFISKGVEEGSIMQAATIRNHKKEDGNTKCDINIVFASLDNDGITPTNITSSREKQEEKLKEWNSWLYKPAFHLICWSAQTYQEKKSGKSIVRVKQLVNIP